MRITCCVRPSSSLRIVRELQQGPAGFRELRVRADEMSSSILATRLAELRDAGVISTDDAGSYRLTELGSELDAAFAPLAAWAGRWAAARSAHDDRIGPAAPE